MTMWKKETRPLRLPAIERKARALNIQNTHHFEKPELIRMIQKMEGSTECFGTGRKECVHTECCWKPECIKK